MNVILDRAHGSNVAGKQSPDGKKEWMWSDKIVNMLALKLINAGHNVFYTCRDDKEPGLKERVKIMNTVPSPALVFSPHNNAAGMGDVWKTARGWSLWTTHGNTKSDKLSNNLYTLLRQTFELPFRTDWSDGDPDYEAHFTVLTSKHPSVMLEWMFQDNKEDSEIIWNQKTNEKLVDTLFIWITNTDLS